MTFRETVAERWTTYVPLNLPQLSALLNQQGGDPEDRALLAARQKLAKARDRRVAALSRAGGNL